MIYDSRSPAFLSGLLNARHLGSFRHREKNFSRLVIGVWSKHKQRPEIEFGNNEEEKITSELPCLSTMKSFAGKLLNACL
jgi:hypothetical protein